MSDLLMQQLSTVQSDKEPTPPTIASATTISPSNFLSFVSGSVVITTMNPFVSGAHMIVLIFTGAPAVIPAGTLPGQFKAAVTPTANIPVVCIWEPISQLWWAGVLKSS